MKDFPKWPVYSRQRMAGRFSDGTSFHFQGEIVYANFGTEKDFDYLQKNGIDLKNSIALVRYGQISRAKKVSLLSLLMFIYPRLICCALL